MDPFISAVYAALAGSAPLVAALGSAPVGSGPAIYTRDPVPEETELPYIVIRGPIAQDPYDTKGDDGRELTIDVDCVAEQSGDPAEIYDVANLARAALHRQPLAVAGFTWITTQVFGPTVLDGEDVYARNLAVQVLYAGA